MVRTGHRAYRSYRHCRPFNPTGGLGKNKVVDNGSNHYRYRVIVGLCRLLAQSNTKA